LNSDFTNKDKITELIRFESSTLPKGEFRSLNGYVASMKPDQKEIYYAAGNSREQLEKNPNIEYFIKNNIEVLYFTDPVDLFVMPYLFDYDGKKIVSIEKAELDLDKKTENTEALPKDSSESLINEIKRVLGDKVEDVVVSKRLVDSPASVVVGKQGIDPQMEKMMKMMDKDFSASKRILEINTGHSLIKNLSKLHIANNNPELLSNCIRQIFEGAMLIDGNLNNTTDFVSRMSEIMTLATNQ
jgi:molecular chaperone HtpG